MESLLLLQKYLKHSSCAFSHPASPSLLTSWCKVCQGSSAEAAGHLQEIPEGT